MKWAACLLVVGLGIAACGGRDEGASAPTDPPPTEAATDDSVASAPESTPGATSPESTGGATTPETTEPEADPCDEPLEATEVGITEDTITIQVMADTGSQFAPGLFQGAVDAIEAYGDYINDNGGLACRQLEVEVWDSKLDPVESKNGLIAACETAFAKVGGYSIFNPDFGPMTNCIDQSGEPTGQPNIPATAVSEEELCAPTTRSVFPLPDDCPWPEGVREVTTYNGNALWYVDEFGDDLHGMFLAAATTPAGLQGSVPIIEGMREAGIEFDDIPRVAPTSEQSALTPVVQRLKDADSNFVYNGSADSLMIKMRKEAAAQGVDVEVWACSLSCYSENMRAAGPDVDGTYVWLPFLPFEEADTNAELQAFMDYVGDDKADAFGAQAWQAAGLFKEAVDRIVARDGANAITRSSLLDELSAINDYTADGWLGVPAGDDFELCQVQTVLRDGEFVRVFPEERGTMDCNPDGSVTMNLDMAALAAEIQ